MKKFVLMTGVIFALQSVPASAIVVLTTGAGSAVTTVEGSADFESTLALFGEPYVEGGMSFSRTNLSYNNNNCGFAGCGFTGFSGNYMYGAGEGGFFEISTTGGTTFQGLEFQVADGYPENVTNVVWDAFLNGVVVGSGLSSVADFSVVGFSGQSFDTLRYTQIRTLGGQNAPAFDSVRAQFTAQSGAVPEPATWAMLILGFGLVGGALRSAKGKQKLAVSYA